MDSPDEKRMHKQNRFQLEKYYDDIIIPHTVLGESFAKIAELSDNRQEHIRQFSELVCTLTDVKSHSPPLSRNILVSALELLDENEYNIGYCDAVLIAYGMCDNHDCTIFINDKTVHRSSKIYSRIKQCAHHINLVDSLKR